MSVVHYPLRLHGVRLEQGGELSLLASVGCILDQVARVSGGRATVSKVTPGLANTKNGGPSPWYVEVWFAFDKDLFERMESLPDEDPWQPGVSQCGKHEIRISRNEETK